MAYTTIRDRILKEMATIIMADSAQIRQKETATVAADHFCYDDLYGAPRGSTIDAVPPNEQALKESLKLSAVNWASTREEAVRHAHFPEGHREAWIKLFIRYNTALPSSAAAEQLFSTAGGILRPRRSSLTASNFEQLVLLKGNSRLFQAALKEEF